MSETFKSKLWLGVLLGVCSFFGTLLANYIDINFGYERNVKQLIAESRNAEVERSRVEIEKFIYEYNKFKDQSNVILSNLAKANVLTAEDFIAPGFNGKNFFISDKDLQDKVSVLLNDTAPSLQDGYFKITTIYKIPVSEDVIATINGIKLIITMWFGKGKDGEPFPFSIDQFEIPIPHWYPESGLNIPPKEPKKIRDACIKKLNEQINALADIRVKIINGEYHFEYNKELIQAAPKQEIP